MQKRSKTVSLRNLRSFQDRLKGAKVFSKLDLKAGYYQVPMDHASSLKTITLTNWGPCSYLRMPMNGLDELGRNVPEDDGDRAPGP